MPILESKGDPSTISRILAFLRTLFRRHPKTGGETEMVPTRAAGTRKRLAEAKACLESLDADIRTREELLVRPDVARIPELFVVESHYRIAVLRAEREFLADLVDRIESGSVGGAEWWNTLHRLLAEGHDMNELSANPAAYFGEEVADLLG